MNDSLIPPADESRTVRPPYSNKGLVQYIESTWAKMIPKEREEKIAEAAVKRWKEEGKL